MGFVGKVQKTLKTNLERVSLNYIIKTSFCPRFPHRNRKAFRESGLIGRYIF